MRDPEVLEILVKHGIKPQYARRVLEIARTIGPKAEPVDQGYIGVMYNAADGYSVIPRLSTENHRGKVAGTRPAEYSRGTSRKLNTQQKPIKELSTMPPRRGRGAAAAPVAEVEETEEAKDYTVYADKAPTVTMEDFYEWLVDEVFGGKYPGDDDSFMDGVRLGGTLRMEFQQSEFNKTRRAERQAERQAASAATNGDAEEEEAPAKPVHRAGRAAAAKPAAAAKASAKGKPAPPRTRRGRASGEAPY